MKRCFLLFALVFLNFRPSISKSLIHSNIGTTQQLQISSTQSTEIMDSKGPSDEEDHLPEVKGGILNMDYHLCSLVFGTYICQALVLNALFIFLSNISQWIQKELSIDTSSILSGRISGILTVALGSYLSYKLSEVAIDKFLALFKDNKLAIRLKKVIKPSKTTLASVSVPLLAFYKCSKYLHNKIPLNVGSLQIYVKNKVLNSEKSEEDFDNNVRISFKGSLGAKKKFKREFAVISAYSIGSFLALGGNLHSFTPSELSHPGAYAVPKLSLEAQGYNYANTAQKRIIQMLGKEYGCHTCGLVSDTERYIADHQPPSGVIKRKLKGKYISFLLRHRLIPLHLVKPKQHFYPQCNKCSLKQSRAVANNRRESVTHYGRLRSYHLCPTTFFVSRVIFDTKWSRLNKKLK